MPQPKANQTEFFFVCGGLDPATFLVTEFEGDENIAQPYTFTISLISSVQDIAADSVTGKRATLYICRDDEYYPYSGVISEFRAIDRTESFATYSVCLVPRLWLLSLNTQTRIFQNMSARAIVKQVLVDAGLDDCCEFKWKESDSKEQEFTVQYQESDLNFITRLMEREGTRYCFSESPCLREEITSEPQGETTLFCDNNTGFADIAGPSTIRYRSHSGLFESVETQREESMSRIELHARAVAAETFCRNYNYRTPEVAISGSRTVPGGVAGTLYRYGGHARDTEDAQSQAVLLTNRLASSREIFAGTGTCRGLRAGARFTLSEHPRKDYNTAHVITSVKHHGAQNAAGTDTPRISYDNSFTTVCGAAADTYCPPVLAAIPHVPGVLTARIEANGGDYAYLDDKGRYKVRLPFDLSDTANSEASKFVRLSSPYAGSNYGIHFPSHEGTEMVIACVDGNPDKILGLATVPDANTVSPVTSSNKEQSVARTAGGNELVMDDLDGKQRIRLTTSAAQVVELDDGNRRIVLQTTDENKVLLDDTNERCDINAGSQTLVLSYKSGEEGITLSTGGGHVIKIDDSGKRLTLQSAAGHVVDMDDNGKKMVLTDCKGKNSVTLDGSKGLILDSQGSIAITASKDIDISGANIAINAGSTGKFDASAGGDMNLKGRNLSAAADSMIGSLKLEGSAAELKGGLQGTTIGGFTVAVKADMDTTVKGLMTTVEASAVNTVKGGIVMIN